MFGNLFTADIQIGLIIAILIVVVMYVLTIIWTMRDAYARGANWKLWGIVALIPFVGVIAYVLMRPPILTIDKDEQELEIALKQRELLKYGSCSRCSYPVKDTYIVCPNCQSRLKDTCTNCGKPLAFDWKACPYCGSPKVFDSSDTPEHKS